MKTSPVITLPPVHRIEGISAPPPGADLQREQVRLQYTDQAGTWHQVDMPAMDALYLLNLLEQWSKEAGLDHLRRSPR